MTVVALYTIGQCAAIPLLAVFNSRATSRVVSYIIPFAIKNVFFRAEGVLVYVIRPLGPLSI